MNFLKSARGKIAAFALGVAVAACGLALANTGGYTGWNPATGLNGFVGAEVSLGTPPAVTMTGSTVGAVVGGPQAGTIAVTTGNASSVVTITFPSAAPTGWVCNVQDVTTSADSPKPASTTATTWVSSSATLVTADVLQYSCTGY